MLASSRGILQSCTHHNRKPISSCPAIDADLLDGFRPGASIYVCTQALAVFAIYVLPRINAPFTLVSGDSDLTVDQGILAHPNVSSILASPHLIAWYAQNLATSAPKLYHLPIGQDYHTISHEAEVWSLDTVSPISQERSLIRIFSDAPRFSDRKLKAYCNWHFEIGRGDRQECLQSLDPTVAFFEPTKVPRQSTWARQSQMMFVVSPFGAGLDCHRTWEALALGCVPILRRSALAPVCSGLPCVFVDDWRQVNTSFLRHSADLMQQAKFQFGPLFKDFWMRKIRMERCIDLPEMTLDEFRKFVVFCSA